MKQNWRHLSTLLLQMEITKEQLRQLNQHNGDDRLAEIIRIFGQLDNNQQIKIYNAIVVESIGK